MLRNREFKLFLLALSIITFLSTGLASYIFSIQASIYIFVTSVLFIFTSYYFTTLRYRQIEKLSNYLRQISNGNYSLDVRDNREGELSILKSEIYKVTLMLSEHGSLLQEDKVKLTNAISDISHQLKTPLTSMVVMADLLSDSKIEPLKRVEFTRNIRIQLERMEWLVSSLLKLSKMDAGTIPFKKEKIYIHSLIQKAVKPIIIPIDVKEQSLKIMGDENIIFVGDLNWTTEALINILKNCVEHTKVGGEISITFEENVLFTEIRISDNGKGISKKDLPYIFKRFYKGKNANADSVGIGLAMAYSIIKSQNGDIEVTSQEGNGTQFIIKFYKQII